MRPIELGLHVASLTACAALGVGLYTLRQSPLPLPAPPTPASTARPAPDEGRVQVLERELESLRLRLKDLEATRGPLAQAPQAGSAPAPSAATLLAALDDPKVQEKIRTVSNPGAPPDFAPVFAQAMQAIGDSGEVDLFHGMELNPTQKDLLQKILEESGQQIGELFQKVEKKEWTREQAVAELRRRREDADARARTVLTDAQFKEYQERLMPMREITTASLSGESKAIVVNRPGVRQTIQVIQEGNREP